MVIERTLIAAAVLAAAVPSAAAAEAAAQSPGLGSALQVALGLVLVLAMVAGTAWLVRRLGAASGPPSGILRIRGGVAVGQRERVVLLEVRDTWLVVGVAPGQVRALHVMGRPEPAEPGALPAGASRSFAQWLQHTVDKYRA